MRIVLTCDETLTSTYRSIPLADFMGCLPVEKLPSIIYNLIDSQVPHKNGVLIYAPYSLRKIEAALVRDGFKDVVVAHPNYIDRYVDEDTTIVGVSAMDPMGYGPVSMMFTSGGIFTSYTKKKFLKLIEKLRVLREKRNLRFKIMVGGAGTWQLTVSQAWKKLGIDHIVIGEVDHVIGDIFRKVEIGNAEEIIFVNSFPSIDEVPTIINPSYKGMIEVMRGCGRNCKFCTPNLRRARYYPIEKILEEVKVNVDAGLNHIWVHSDDVFLYRLEDHKNFHPNVDAVIELFSAIKNTLNVEYANPTHGSIAPVVAAPRMIKKLSEILDAGPDKWIGIQPGMETASPKLISRYMENKPKPFSTDEWPQILLEATYIFNKYYWYPAYTIIIGLPGETDEDDMETVSLVITMEKMLKEKLGSRNRFIIAPLSFVPMGLMSNHNFFHIIDEMTEARYLLIYYTIKHLAREIYSHLPDYTRHHPYKKFVVYPVTKIGVWSVLRALRSWGINHGYDPDKPIKPLDIHISITA